MGAKPSLLFGLEALLFVLGCLAQDFIFCPERDFVSSEVGLVRQLGVCGGDPEAAAGRLSYLLGREGEEHMASLFPWVKGSQPMTIQEHDPLEPAHHWPLGQPPGKPHSCHLPPNYADLVMVVTSHGEVRCTPEGCCSRGLCHLQGWSFPARRASESPPACHEKTGPDSGSLGFSRLVYKQCQGGGDLFCGKLLCSDAKLVPVLPDGSVILTLASRSGIICWGTDYHHERVLVQIPEVDKVNDCNPCGEGFLCINQTCHSVSVFNIDCVSDRCMKGGVCKSHRNCRCKEERDPQVLKKPKYGESPKWNKSPRKSVFTLVLFLIRFFLLITSIGVAFLAKIIATLFV